MQPPPPEGYRFPTKADDMRELYDNDELIELCHCGHTRNEHLGTNGDGPCLKCACDRFTRKTWLVSTDL